MESISPIRLLIRVVGPFFLLTFLTPLEPANLQVRVVEGQSIVYPIGSRATRGITVQVTDETNRPVEGASVSFRLPQEGPGGTFATGARTEIATTRADGRASVWGMQWNRTPGAFEIRITAARGDTRAGTVCALQLTNALAAAVPAARFGQRRGHKFLWITLAVAGTAAGGAAAVAWSGKAGTGAGSSPPTSVQIGAPTIVLGRP